MEIPGLFRVAIVGLMILVPVFFIYKRAGFNPVWCLLVFVPGFGLLAVFLQLAFMPWPNQMNNEEQ
jgi:hypothetical protein